MNANPLERPSFVVLKRQSVTSPTAVKYSRRRSSVAFGGKFLAITLEETVVLLLAFLATAFVRC
jgi:hypothetical protein